MVSYDRSSHLLIQPQVRHSEEQEILTSKAGSWPSGGLGPGGHRGGQLHCLPLPFAFLDPKTYFWFLVHSPLPVTLLFVFSLLLEVADSHITSQWQPSRLAERLTVYILGLVVQSGYICHEVGR